jgi:hypothetical protein
MENIKHNIIPILLIMLAAYILTIGIYDVWASCLFLAYLLYDPSNKPPSEGFELRIE